MRLRRKIRLFLYKIGLVKTKGNYLDFSEDYDIPIVELDIVLERV